MAQCLALQADYLVQYIHIKGILYMSMNLYRPNKGT